MAKVLIHIGYRKAASTFIKNWFTNHPQLHYENRKIAGFSKTTALLSFIGNNNPADIQYYILSDNFTLFRGEKPEKTKLNIQNYQKQSCDLLYSLFPNAKILIITRAPKSAILSEYNESIKNGGHLTFNELSLLPETHSYFEAILDYNFTINLYYRKFGLDNVIVLPYELLADNPESFINYLEQSMNIKHVPVTSTSLNPSLSPNDSYWLLKISKIFYLFSRPFGKIGKKLYYSYCKWLEKRNSQKRKLFILIKILSSIFGYKKENIILSEELVNSYKISSEIFQNLTVYKKYLNLYCPTKRND